jgi:hypothetical protein
LVNVDGFPNIEWIGEQTNYTLDIATKLIGRYIFPKEGYTNTPYLLDGTERKDAQTIKENFIPWILQHDKDLEALLDGFNEKQFEKTNRDALDKLLNMTINEYMNEIADTPTPASDILLTTEDEQITFEQFNRYVDELESRGKKEKYVGVDLPDMKASEFLESLSKKVLDPEFFNIDITLKDILNQTDQSKYFYQLTPTQMKDPLFQRLFAELSEEEYRVADVDIPGKQLLSVDNPGEFLQRYETVMRRNRPVEVTAINNGKKEVFEAMAGDIFNFASEEIKNTIMNKLLSGYGQYDTEESKLTERELDTKIAIHFLAAVEHSRHSDETVIDMDFLYPFSILPGFSRVENSINEFKKNGKKMIKLMKPKEGLPKIIFKTGEDIDAEIREIERVFDFNSDFRDEEDQDKYDEALSITNEVIYWLGERKIKNTLVSGATVNRSIEKFLKNMSKELSGQVYTVEFSTKSGTELDASREDLGLLIMGGNNPISLNKLKNILKKEPVSKLTATNVTDNDIKPFTKGSVRSTETKASRRTPMKFTVGPLDLSKGSALPDAAKSKVQVLDAGVAESKISQLVKIKKELKNYSRKKIKESKDLTPVEEIYNIAVGIRDAADPILKKVKTLDLLDSEDPKKIISRTNINKLVDILANVITSSESVQDSKIDGVGIIELIDNISDDFARDDLPFEDLRGKLIELKEICEVVTSMLEPSSDYPKQRTYMTEEEQDEEGERLRREMAEDDDDEDSLEVATTQGEEGETVEEEDTDIKEKDELNKDDYEFIMNELRTNDETSLVSIINSIDDPAIEALLDSYNMIIEEVNNIKEYTKDELGPKGHKLYLAVIDLKGQRGTLEALKDSTKIIKQIKTDIVKLEESDKNISSASGRLGNLLKTYDIAEIVTETIAEQSGFNTVNIVDLIVNFDLVFVEDIKNGASFNELRGKVNFEYKIIQVMETTSGKYDFPTVDAVQRKGSAKRMVNIADRARAKGTTKGQIQDERKAKIYNQIYDNLLELDNILRRVEAE